MRKFFALVVITLTLIEPALSAAASEPGSASPAFNESDGCADPAGFHGPRATRSGVLPNDEPLYGPLADVFGRSIGSVKTQLVWWTVPMSGGHRVRIHRFALPAFEQVTENLEAAALTYAVRPSETLAFSPRTISGRRSVSFHAFGIAVDINSSTNPYRSDNVLNTDMPPWFVDAWRSAGFCWGGDWQEVKDPMHFSWKGPAYTPGYPLDLVDQAPTSALAAWQLHVPTDLRWVLDHPARFYLRDGNRDGAVDVYRLRSWAGGTLIELSRSSMDFSICGVWREWSPTPFSGPMLMADFDNTSRMDLWTFDVSGAQVLIRIWLHRTDFGTHIEQSTAVPVSTGMRFEAGDVDDDGVIDLVVGRPGSPTTIEVWSGASGFTSQLVSTSVPVDTSAETLQVSLTDLDRDDQLDLAVGKTAGAGAEIIVTTAASGFTTTSARPSITAGSTLIAVEFGDFDGDGRDDIISLGSAGQLRAHLGGQLPGSVYLRNWFRDPGWTCPPNEDIDLPDEIDAHLPRLAGGDRYATAAALSAKHFSDGASTVFVTSGLNFPDALAAAPVAAGFGAPVLLTHPDALPAATATEIRRLGATRVVVAGGTGAVSDAVAASLARLPSVTTVERAAGADRYATAAALAALLENPRTVYVATGENFPDALAAAPAAALDGAPLLLVSSTGIPSATKAALARISPEQIILLGGTGVIPQRVATELEIYGQVSRIAGATRYATAVAIAGRLPDKGRVMVVNGEDFADAMAAGAAAGVQGIPLILVQKTQTPVESERYLTSLQPSVIEIIGGPAAVTNLVRATLIDYVYPT